MSEFTEIMRQAKQMCTAHGCLCSTNNCPLDNGEACRLNIDLDGEDYNELERIIMDWAAEHPEPVYPSWKEGWKQLFPEADIRHTLCPVVFGDKYRCDWCHDDKDDNDNCDECLKRPMPSEVAEKLGIKPVAPEKPVPEHDGCEGCKWCSKTEKDEPCVNCRGTLYCDVDEKPDLWEAADNGQ